MENNKVFINPKSGSIRLTGSVDIVDSEGNVTETIENPKFCGCGLSKDKPWCDSSHKVFTAPVQRLEAAALNQTATDPFDPSLETAIAVRQKLVEHKVHKGEKIVGVKVGGALESVENPNGILIYGYLTDAMKCDSTFNTAQYIFPRAEAEVVFKLSQDIAGVIKAENAHEYASHVAAGMEIFDYRYGQVQIYSKDAIADNAGAAAFAHSQWREASKDIFNNLQAEVNENGVSQASAPISAIRGNPWLALVELSKALARDGVLLPAGSIVFSGSATKGLPLVQGNTYEVKIEGLGSVEVKTNS